MNLQQYKERKQADYAVFAEAVARILRMAIQVFNEDIHIPPIQHRAKDPVSLEKKIADRNANPENRAKIDPESIEDGVKDLAGVRVVFYTNGDVERFLQSGIIADNFDIDQDNTKYHHPDPKDGESANQFRSANIVVRLKESRVTLSEYARFSGMRCEIQVQTILNHAWSETAHDITYKGLRLPGYGNRLRERLQKQLNDIMLKYLVPAGHEFQLVWDAYQRLLAGKNLIEDDTISELVELKNNNDRLDRLKMYDELVLGYLDDYQQQYPDIRSQLTLSAIAALKTPPIPREISGMKFDGATAKEYLNEVLTILNRYRLVDAEGTLDDLFKLYDSAPEEAQRDEIAAAAKKFAEHDLDVMKVAGLHIELTVSQKLMALTNSEVAARRDLVLALSDAVLSTEVTGISSTYKSVTISTGAIVSSDRMRGIRRDILERLTSLYKSSNSETEKREVIQILNGAMRLPHTVNYSDDLMCDVINDSVFVAQFYATIAEDEIFEVLQSLEHDLLWWHRWTAGVKEPEYSRNDILQAKADLDTAIATFRKVVDANDGYGIHKTLVGYESVFPPMWENDDAEFDVSGVVEYRKQRIAEFVEQISPKSADYWFDVIIRVFQTISDDMATFMYMEPFLTQIGERRPEIAVDYLTKLAPEEPTARSAPGLLIGLARSKLAAKADEIIEAWLAKDMFLTEVAHYSHGAPTMNIDRLALLAGKAVQRDDMDLLLFVVLASFNNGSQHVTEIEQRILVPALKYAIDKKNAAWVNTIWWMPEETSLLPHLSDDAYSLMVRSMVHMPRIEHRTERILKFIGKRLPELVVRLFDLRMEESGEDDGDVFEKFEPVPYRLHGLEEVMQEAPEALITVVRRHYAKDGYVERDRAIRLLHNTFPVITDNLRKHLLDLIAGGKRDDIVYVGLLLREYEGAREIEEIAKEMVDALPPNDKLLAEVRVALQSSGVVSGEFGFVEVYKDRKARVEEWLNDPRKKVREFAEGFIHRMDNAIAAEQKRVEEDIARMRGEYGNDDDKDSEDGDDESDDGNGAAPQSEV